MNFVILGNLRVQVSNTWRVSGDDRAVQILCFADISHEERIYENILLLRLEIRGDPEDGWRVDDEFTRSLPYMLPVEAFRRYLIEQFEECRQERVSIHGKNPWDPIFMGLGEYILGLQSFDEARSNLAQARRGIERLQQRLSDRHLDDDGRAKINRQAFRILECLALNPDTRREFSRGEPLKK